MDMRLMLVVLCFVAGVALRRSDGKKIHKFEVKVGSLEDAKSVATILKRTATYEEVLTIKYIESAFCLGKQVVLVVTTDDEKYFGGRLKSGVRPEVKWTEDALGKAMSMVLEIRYYSYENDDLGLDGAMSEKNSEEIVKVRLDKMGNMSKEKVEKKGIGIECDIMNELCRVEDDVEKKEILCEDAEKVCNVKNSRGQDGVSDIAKCIAECLPKCIIFGGDCIGCIVKCVKK